MFERISRVPSASWLPQSAAPTPSRPIGSCGATCSAAASLPAGAAEILDAEGEPLRVVTAEGSSVINPPVYSRAILVEEDCCVVGLQVFVLKNTIDFSTSLTCSLEGSNDDENWGSIASSSITFGALALGLGSVRVASVAWRYVRVKYAAGSPEFDGGVAILRPMLNFCRG